MTPKGIGTPVRPDGQYSSSGVSVAMSRQSTPFGTDGALSLVHGKLGSPLAANCWATSSIFRPVCYETFHAVGINSGTSWP